MGSLQRRMARQRLRDMQKWMWKQENATTLVELLSRLGQKDFVLAKYEEALMRLNQKNEVLQTLLVEWLETPYFNTQEEYEVWAKPFREKVMLNVGPIEASEEAVEDGEDDGSEREEIESPGEESGNSDESSEGS